MNAMRDAINRHRAWFCLDCGKCSAVCPITAHETRRFSSPRLLVEQSLAGRSAEVMAAPLFWQCLGCGRCTELCPADVHFGDLLREMRSVARGDGQVPSCTHAEVIQTWVRMMTDPHLQQRRCEWLTEDLEVAADGDTLYFVGCLPYYDALFKSLGFEGLAIARATVKLLNHVGVVPQISATERCCGHDQLWEGETETFEKLARLNLQMLRDSGARRIVTHCPECARTLKTDYPRLVGDHGMEVLHLTELLNQPEYRLRLEASDPAGGTTVTFHDPCRLGRHLQVYDPPRELLQRQGFVLHEMRHHRGNSVCCGTSGWSACGRVSKQIQLGRLQEACETGAGLLVTACLKCQIHLRCAMADPDANAMPVRDLATVIAENL